MDKKYTILGVLFLLAGFGVMFWQSQHLLTLPPQTITQAPISKPTTKDALTDGPTSLIQSIQDASIQAEVIQTPNETTYTLENDHILVRLTTNGGAIKDITLKKYPLELDGPTSFIFNAENKNPALAINLSNGSLPQSFSVPYELVDSSSTLLRLRHTTAEGLEIIRAYSITNTNNGQDPYIITHETRFTNKSNQSFDLKRIFVTIGSFPETQGDSAGEYLNFGYYNGKDAEFIKITEFQDHKGFFGIGQKQALPYKMKETPKPIVWASVKNQFFASVLTPQTPGIGIYAEPTTLNTSNSTQDGITGSILFSLGTLLPQENKILDMQYYVGPKELRRLENLGQNQELIMQFGFFSIISKFLLSIMLIINKFIPNWGLTIIAVTVLIKLILWPLTSAQVRSAKRMASIQEPLKALKEKYANNPQKQQAETMKLFKEHKVNPAAGCLPLIVQLPIFLGLYFMLRTSSELRFAPFLWMPDLSVADTVYTISGFPINPLPLLMGLTMYYQMKMMPSPGTDDTQRKLFAFMPFIFLFFCYNFPSGLVLYWTVQNILTIIQQYFTNKVSTPPSSLLESKSNPSK